MKKILVITNHSYMLYRFRLELIEALAENNEIVISMPFVGHEDDFAALGYRVIETEVDRRGVNPITDIKLFNNYRRLLKEEKPDFVITYSIKPNVYGGFAARLAGVPYCANVQGLGSAFESKLLSRLVSVMYKTALRRAETVFFENTEDERLFVSRHIVSQSKTTTVPGAGINLDKYQYAEYPENEKFHFLYLGRLMREKGMDELFDVVERLFSDRENFVLDLVGFFEDEYRDRIARLEALGVVRFHGFITDPRPYYAASDCVVMPSWHEGMSNVLLEAAAVGRPVVTTDISGCREAVDDGASGLLVRVKDQDDLYDKMKKMLHTDAASRKRMGEAAREKMKREFDKEKVVGLTLQSIKYRETRNT